MLRRGFLKMVASCVLLPVANLVPLPKLSAKAKDLNVRECFISLFTGPGEEVSYTSYTRQKVDLLYDEKQNTLVNDKLIEFPLNNAKELRLTHIKVFDSDGKEIASGPLNSECTIWEGAQPRIQTNALSVTEAYPKE